MRVLHIGKFYPPFAGGIESFLADLLPALAAQNIDCRALVHGHESSGAWFPPVQTDPAPYQQIYRAPCYGRLLYAPISPHFPYWINQVLKTWPPELLHIHMPNTSAFWLLFSAQARKIPWVVHWHSDVVSSALDKRLALAYKLYRPFEQRLLRHSQAVIATSPPYLESSIALQDWRERCEVIPLGLNAQRLPAPAELPDNLWPAGKLRVLHVGRQTYYKGQSVLLEALAQAEDCSLLMVGKGELQAQLRAQVQALGLENRVRLLGYQSDEELAALFASCDCFCLPSLERTEAFGVVLMEAMAHGKPAIATTIPGSGTGWVVEHEQTGLLVPPGDVQALSVALRRLRDKPELRDQLGAQAQIRLQQRFSLEAVASQTAALYQRILSARSS